jgi:uncharacterized coiled-coil protein SlyX
MPALDLETLAARVAGHDESLRAISDTLVDLTEDVRGLARGMDDLTQRVDGLQQTVDQHSATLERHSAILDQHTATLDQHTGLLTEILRIVRASAPDGPGPAVGEGDRPSADGDR